MRHALLVALGGGLGSVLRWWLSGAVERASGGAFPWGTLAVNALGSLAIGVVSALTIERALGAPAPRAFLVAGVLGGFTTFSAYSYETLALIRDGQWAPAAGYAAGSVVLALGAALAGFAIGARIG